MNPYAGSYSVPADAEEVEKTSEDSGSSREIATKEKDREWQEVQEVDTERPFDYFARPQPKYFYLFYSYHPQQTSKKAIPKVFHSKDGTNRKWLTYCESSHSLYCLLCLMFAKPASDNAFVKGGMQAWKHVHQRIEEHERSGLHRDSANAYFLRASGADISSLLKNKQMSAHREEVRKKRQVMERVVNVIKCIGKRGLSYRGGSHEAAYSLENVALDRGNFLEIIMLLSEYDTTLQEHVNDCIKKSKRLHEAGRGSLLTLLSKQTGNKIIDVIRILIQHTVASEVKKAKMFSIQLDTTQDLTSKDQCAVVLRYVTDVIHERLIAVIDCESSTGAFFVELVKETVEKVDIDIKHALVTRLMELLTCRGNTRDSLH